MANDSELDKAIMFLDGLKFIPIPRFVQVVGVPQDIELQDDEYLIHIINEAEPWATDGWSYNYYATPDCDLIPDFRPFELVSNWNEAYQEAEETGRMKELDRAVEIADALLVVAIRNGATAHV